MLIPRLSPARSRHQIFCFQRLQSRKKSGGGRSPSPGAGAASEDVGQEGGAEGGAGKQQLPAPPIQTNFSLKLLALEKKTKLQVGLVREK